MKFPILLKKGKLFIWYKSHWINVSLESSVRGDGIRGYYRFFKGLFSCLIGKHSFWRVFQMKTKTSHIKCAYCRKEKNETD